MILPKSVCLKSPHRSSAFFQIKSAYEAADPVNSVILASNHLLHETVQFQASDCQPPFAQKRVDSSLITQIESNLVLQIAAF